ncbi:MAG TPA: hypothetical protein EYP20_05685, partial [Aigarchaeota archaeon]|nr:hypothetical protein [Aigarchaeota archaeon]
MTETPQPQAQTQKQTQTPPQQTIQIHPIADAVTDAIGWSIPGLQAYFNSPYWRPVLLKDAVVYVWPDNDANTAAYEALLVPSRPLFRLFYITRSTGRILLFLVEPQIPGGRIGNIYKKPLVFDNYYLSEFIALFVAFRGDLKRIVECGVGGHG